MSLTLVAVPIGNQQDITLRALDTLKEAELVIGEERKPLFRLFKELGLGRPKDFRLLNEHTQKRELTELVKICAEHRVALITDCGTPGFSDPGADLVALCRKHKVEVTSNPGPSSLTTFISLCGLPLKQFHFQGFLPRESEERRRCLLTISQAQQPVIVMDTPYRLKKTLEQISQYCSGKRLVVGMNLTKDNEWILAGTPQSVLKNYDGSKREFIVLIY